MGDRTNPIRETDDAARAQARRLMAEAVTVALGVLDPETGGPFVSRVAFGLDPDGVPMTLVSDLAAHARALAADPRASLLLGEPGPKGDPLAHPRLTLRVRARILAPAPPARAALRAAWIARHPKARLYVDFADFRFVAFDVESGLLNAGFGKAYELAANDLRVP